MNKIRMSQNTGKLKLLEIVEAILARELVILVLGILIYTSLFLFLDHLAVQNLILANFVIVYAIIKILYILFFTFKRFDRCLMLSNTFYDDLTSYSIIIGIMVVSFALDFLCINLCLPGSFLGTNMGSSLISDIFNFLYFSLVTFSTIGFGDIVPLKFHSRFLVSLEVIASFIMIVFVIANINNIRISKKYLGAKD